MFAIECRLLVKRKKIFVMCLLFSLCITFWGIRIAIRESYLNIGSLRGTIGLAKYSFIFFLLLSYLYTNENCKNGIDEVIAASGMGKLKAVMYKIMVLQLWSIVLTTGFFMINIMFSPRINSLTYVWYDVQVWTLYFILPNLLASLFGLCLAGLQNKRVGCLGIILISYIFAGGFPTFLQMMSQKVDVIYRIADLFCIFARGTARTPNYYYLIPIEYNNLLRLLLWIILVGIFLSCLFKTIHGKKWTAALSGIFISLFFIYVQPFGSAYFDEHLNGHDEWSADQYYYSIFHYEGKEEPAEFQVVDYDINMSVGRQLSAEVIMTPDKTDLPEYAFTLYHGYRVKSVRDSYGNNLPYDRDGDYIQIINENDSLDEIHICYSGYSLYFYSTSQGIRLPAYFPYYPIAGYRKIFDNNAYGYVRDTTDDTAHYHLTLKTPEPVFCSLLQNEDGSYEGDAVGLTILGSRFAKCFAQDGLRIVYSELEYPEEEIQAYHRQLVELGVRGEPLQIVFLDAYGGYEKYYADADQLITLGFTLEEDYEKYLDELREEKQND